MIHIDENRLLAYVLEVFDCDSEREEIAAHLAGCPECRARLDEVRGDVEIIGNVRPYGKVSWITNPKARGRTVYAILRAAAMIVMGAFAGFAASSLVHHQPTEVVPQYVVLSPPADCSSGCAVTDVTEVPPRYYEDLPGK
jgi:anti-sigma factor RsiW